MSEPTLADVLAALDRLTLEFRRGLEELGAHVGRLEARQEEIVRARAQRAMLAAARGRRRQNANRTRRAGSEEAAARPREGPLRASG